MLISQAADSNSLLVRWNERVMIMQSSLEIIEMKRANSRTYAFGRLELSNVKLRLRLVVIFPLVRELKAMWTGRVINCALYKWLGYASVIEQESRKAEIFQSPAGAYVQNERKMKSNWHFPPRDFWLLFSTNLNGYLTASLQSSFGPSPCDWWFPLQHPGRHISLSSVCSVLKWTILTNLMEKSFRLL